VSEYPEHDKLTKVKDQTHAIGDFLEWLEYEKQIELCRAARVGDGFWPVGSFMNLLAEWAGIDPDVLEAEKRQMVDKLRDTTGS
jgi:hypothetical protein